MEPLMEDTARNWSSGGLFSRYGSGGSKTPTSSRPNTSSGPASPDSSRLIDLASALQGDPGLANLVRKSSLNFISRTPQTPNHLPIVSVPSPERGTETTRSKKNPPVSIRSYDKGRRNSLTKTISNSSIHDKAHLDWIPTKESFSRKDTNKDSASSRESSSSTYPYEKMLANYGLHSTRAATSDSTMNGASAVLGSGFAGPLSPPMEIISHQHIQEMASKRISTLDYLRKAHEGRVYWFNTLLFTKADLSRLPYFEARKLSRRATNYLLLGLSIPTVLDVYSSTPLEFLRTLNALLAEFESFQSSHPPDGSSSLSRARIPQMFKRSIGTNGSKARRTSSAADIGLPYGSLDPSETSPMSAFPSSDSDLLPGEEYTHLMTPSLPFDPDFYETFATLCDVLIDCYAKLIKLVASPKECGPAVAEAFTNADKRVRKLLIYGIVKEFEEASRTGAKAEVAGVGKVVLGGLM